MNVEQIAVDAVSAQFSRVERLDMEIASKDRTAFTDGHLDLYEDQARKSQFQGRIPLQVKGRVWRKKVFPDAASFPLSITDAKGYLVLRGVLLFVVLVDRKIDRHQVYARMLTPSFLRNFVLQAGDQKTQVVHLSRIPETSDAKIALVSFAIEASRESAPITFDPILFERGLNLTIYSPSPLDFSRPVDLGYADLDTNDHSLLVRTEDGLTGTLDGFLTVYPADYVEHDLPFSVSAGDAIFETPRGRKVDADTLHIVLNESLSIDLSRSGKQLSGKVNLTETGTFSGYLDAIDFFLGACDKRAFTIGNVNAPFSVGEVGNLDGLRAKQRQLRKFREVFEVLGVREESIALVDLDEKSRIQLEAMHRGLVLRQPIPAEEAKSGRIGLSVCGWTVELMCRYDPGEHEWELVDLFSPESRQLLATTATSADGEETNYLITPYDLVDADRMRTLLNLHLGNLVKAYDSIPFSPATETNSTNTVLNLIRCADASPSRRVEFIDAAHELNAWLRGKEPNSAIYQINEWQIRARISGLSPEDEAAVHELMHEGNVPGYSHAVRGYVCSILVKDGSGVSYWFDRLTESEAEMLGDWPIVNLVEQFCLGGTINNSGATE